MGIDLEGGNRPSPQEVKDEGRKDFRRRTLPLALVAVVQGLLLWGFTSQPWVVLLLPPSWLGSVFFIMTIWHTAEQRAEMEALNRQYDQEQALYDRRRLQEAADLEAKQPIIRVRLDRTFWIPGPLDT